MGDIRPPIGAAVGAFGLPATVTLPGGGPAVQTNVFWLTSRPMEYPVGAEYRRSEQLRVLVIPIADLPQAPPRGTVVAVAEYKGGVVLNWKVDEADRADYDHYRAVMVPA